ncbi:MAG: tRNA 2-thiocytidine(32) synthetase TtcA [Gammaproteobacteria bacterium]|nr:tRNA 2-thiocytidine(32) synthetase TtcA [Gammaproteobacteria bacterium]
MEPHKKRTIDANKRAKRLRRSVGQAIADFNMIEPGDRVLVCVSGGKDSHAMADILWDLKRRAPVDFDMTAFNLDQKQPGFPEHVLPEYYAGRGIPFEVVEQDTYSAVTDIIPEGRTMCGLCSRLRRGIVYSHARQHGYTKIALGHHREDILETLLMNMFHGGTLKTMPPKLVSDDGDNIVIRPLAYCREKDLARYAVDRGFPIIPCNLCGNQENLERVRTKVLLAEWEKQYPGRIENMMRSLQNVKPSHLLDTALYDYDGFRVRDNREQGSESNADDEKIIQFFDRRPARTG